MQDFGIPIEYESANKFELLNYFDRIGIFKMTNFVDFAQNSFVNVILH